MTQSRKKVAVFSILLAVVGGGWTMLALLSAYMTATGQLQSYDIIWPVAVSILGIILAAGIHLSPGTETAAVWPWCVPVTFWQVGRYFLY